MYNLRKMLKTVMSRLKAVKVLGQGGGREGEEVGGIGSKMAVTPIRVAAILNEVEKACALVCLFSFV